MSDFPTLAEVTVQHLWTCDCGEAYARGNRRAIAEHLQTEWVKARTIETVEQLDALPVGSVIGLGTGCGLYEKDTHGDWGFPPDNRAYLINEAWAAGTKVRLLFHPEHDR